MAERFPYLARQMAGPVAMSFGKGIDHVYERDTEFIEFMSSFSLDTLSGVWLDRIGTALGMPRPYYMLPDTMSVFMFDSTVFVLDGDSHGFSTESPVMVGGKRVTRDNGGLLDDIFKNQAISPMVDKDYRRYIYAACRAKRARSVKAIVDVLEGVTGSGMYVVDFEDNSGMGYMVKVTLPVSLIPYKEALEGVFGLVFTVEPVIRFEFDPYFFDRYLVSRMRDVVLSVTGSENFTIKYLYDVTVLYVTVTLGDTTMGYEDEVRRALDEEFGGHGDLVITVVSDGSLHVGE